MRRKRRDHPGPYAARILTFFTLCIETNVGVSLFSNVISLRHCSGVRRGIHSVLLGFAQEAVPAGAELCGGDEMAHSIAASIDALTAGDESAAVFKRDIGELMLRPL